MRLMKTNWLWATAAAAGLLAGSTGVRAEGLDHVFLDARQAAEAAVAAVDELYQSPQTPFQAHAREAIQPFRDRLRQTLADERATERQLLRATLELRAAVGQLKRLRTAEKEIFEARKLAETPVRGFGRRYQVAIIPAGDQVQAVLTRGDLTFDELTALTRQLKEAVDAFARTGELRAVAAEAVTKVEHLEPHAKRGVPGVAEALPSLNALSENIQRRLADPDATIEQVEGLVEQVDAELREVRHRFAMEFQEAVDHPSRPLPEGMSAEQVQQAAEFKLPAKGWRFHGDEFGFGYHDGWHTTDYDDNGWTPVEIEAAWGDFLEQNVIGVGWYRADIAVPDMPAHDALVIEFGGVDEEAWVWIDGQYVGGQAIGSAGWDQPFQLDVTGIVTPGETHQITVRVNNVAWAGGIWRPVTLRALRVTNP